MAPSKVEHFAAEADGARDRIASTIDEIQERLDPRRIISDVTNRVAGSSTQIVGQASETVRSHPLMIGAGIAAVALALLARNRLSHARVDLDYGGTDYTDYDDGFGFAEGTPSRLYADEADEDVAGTVKDRARVLAARTGATVGENPVVAIAVGLFAGAALGALFPTTEAERRALGDAGHRLGAAAKSAARRASEELSAAGLSVDNMAAQIDSAKSAVKSAVSAARQEFKA